jgi:hypothetical protein
MRYLRYLILLLMAAALLGCGASARRSAPAVEAAPRAPDDQVVRGVGNLRRLLALPVVVEQGSCDWPDVARDLDEAAIRFLRDWKGYDIVRPAELGATWTLARQVGVWQEKDAGKGKPPADLRARLMEAAEALAADGVLVIHAAPECPAGAGAGLLTLPARLAGSLNRSLSAGIFEAERGTLIWHNQIDPAGWDPGRYGARPPPRFETRQAGEALFAPIENAVPAVLKAPPRPRKVPAEPAASAVVVTPAREPTALAPTPLAPAAGTSPPAAPAAPAEAPPLPTVAPAPEPPAAPVSDTPPAATPPGTAVPVPESPPAPEAGTPAAAGQSPPASEGSSTPVQGTPPETSGPTPPLPSPEPAVPGPMAEPAAGPSAAPPSEPSASPPPPTGEPVPALPAPETPASPRPPEQPVAPQAPPDPDVEPPPMKAPIRT